MLDLLGASALTGLGSFFCRTWMVKIASSIIKLFHTSTFMSRVIGWVKEYLFTPNTLEACRISMARYFVFGRPLGIRGVIPCIFTIRAK